jgi:hypothetical protein
VLWRIPKTQALFEQQADALRTCAGPDTLVLAGGMLKHLPEKMYEALSEFANVEVLPARKKARVYRLNSISARAFSSNSSRSCRAPNASPISAAAAAFSACWQNDASPGPQSNSSTIPIRQWRQPNAITATTVLQMARRPRDFMSTMVSVRTAASRSI